MKTLNLIFALFCASSLIMVPFIIIFLIWAFDIVMLKLFFTDLVVILVSFIGFYATTEDDKDDDEPK